MGSKRVNVKAILADADLRRKLMVSTIRATQAREGIDTTPEQADRAYYVVSEGEQAAFFDLERFRAGKRDGGDRREEFFAKALGEGSPEEVRFNVARRDFTTIEGSPLSYRSVRLVAHIFRDCPGLEPAWGRARQGAGTADDPRYVRMCWEIPQGATEGALQWVPFAKGGDYCRFYFDVQLRVHWDKERGTFAHFYGRKGREQERPVSAGDFFRPGLTWPRRTQRGFNLRVLPEGCVFSDKGPAIFPVREEDTDFILGVANSAPAEYILRGLMSFGSWEVGVVKKLPVPQVPKKLRDQVGARARAIYSEKSKWDQGNEVSSGFVRPWLLSMSDRSLSLPSTLDALATGESNREATISREYEALNDAVYKLYGIPDATRAVIERSLGERPPEILWPQMERKTTDQKRMEHVWRLLSYAVKRVLESDDDGIAAFNAVNGEARLVERVRNELSMLFPDRDANQIEVEIGNELKKTVKGYRKCASIEEWLDNAFFEYHAGLYKNRPIFWHVASAQGTSRFAFGALVHYHRFDKNRMAKLRASYLRDAIEEFRREAGLADKADRTDDRLELQAKVEEAQALDKKLQLIQEGRFEGAEGGERDYRILTPWKEPGDRPKGWDPDLDDGVKVNIEPFEKAGVLRIGKVT